MPDPETFDRLVDEYVAKCDENDEPVTFTGMALALGFVERKSLYRYGDRPEFGPSVKRARMIVESRYEKHLFVKGGQVAGAIFALKNHGWRDKPEGDTRSADEKAQAVRDALAAMQATVPDAP